jgi:hypothetical protein
MRNASELAFGPVRRAGQTFIPGGDPPGERLLWPAGPATLDRPVQSHECDRTTSPHCVGTLSGNPAGPAGRITPSPGPDATSARTTSPHRVGTLWGNRVGPAGRITPSPRPDATSGPDNIPSLCGSPLGKSCWARWPYHAIAQSRRHECTDHVPLSGSPLGKIVLAPRPVSHHRPIQTPRVHGPRPSPWVPPGENRVGTAARITPSADPDATSARTTSLSVGPPWGKLCWHRGPYHAIALSRRHQCTDHVPLSGSPLGKWRWPRGPYHTIGRSTPRVHGPRLSPWVPRGENRIGPRAPRGQTPASHQ